MGYALLWIENLIVSLLLVAIVLACVGRLRRPWLQRALWVPVPLVLLLLYAGLILIAALLQAKLVTNRWLYPALALTVFFLVGVVWLRISGLRRVGEGSAQTTAATWPRGKLAIALGVAVALHLMTYWNLDLAVRQQLGALRAEAGALALSIAPPRILDRDNAALVYERAFEGLLPIESWEKTWRDKWQDKWYQWTQQGQAGFDPKDPDLRRFLQNHAAQLALLHEAAAKPGCYFEHEYHWPTIAMALPELGRIRDTARQLALDARVKAADGDVPAALQDVNTVYVMAQHVSTEPILIALLASIAIERTAAETLQAVLAGKQISAEDLAVLHIDEYPSYPRLLDRALRMDEASRLVAFCELGSGQWGFQDLVPDEMPDVAPVSHKSPALSSVYRVFLFSDDLETHRRFSEECRSLAAKPYHEARDRWKDTQFHQDLKMGRPIGLLNQLLMPALSSCAERVAQADARRRAVRLGLALEQYRARHGRFPDKLEDLAPECIPAVPIDPFDGKPMKLKPTDHGLVVYSIGPDMTDNGGAAFDSNENKGDITFELSDRKP